MRKISLKSLKLSLILIAVIILLIFLHYITILKPVENSILKLIKPINEIVYDISAKINGYFQFKIEEKNIFKENGELKQEINKLTIENAQLQIFEKENEILKKELNFLEEKKYNFRVARIIGKSPLNSSIIILNKGEKDGIKINLPVVADEGIIVGKIIKVEEAASFALLLDDNQSKIAASILDVDSTAGVIEGEYGLSLKMYLIPRNQTVNINDLVVTSGLENNIPKGLIIGKINRLTTKSHDLFQGATIKPFIPYEDLSLVSIIIP